MTEAEWLTCNDPGAMRQALGRSLAARKLRLFASACCRRLTRHFKDERSLQLIEASDQFADEQLDSEQLAEAFDNAGEAQEAIHWEGGDAIDQASAEAVLGLRKELDLNAIFEGIDEVVGSLGRAEAWERIYVSGRHWRESEAEASKVEEGAWRKEAAALATLFRDIFGNPFRPVNFAPEWHTETTSAIAQQMYESRDFSAMPTLADALQDAGCDNNNILNHCRDPQQTHVRGCWVVDLVLRRE